MSPSLPYRFDPDARAADLHDRYGELEPGTETGTTVTVRESTAALMRRIVPPFPEASQPSNRSIEEIPD